MNITTQATKAAQVLKNGGIVIFPTDTVWGIGASLNRLASLQRLYQIKKRPKTKPTAVLIGSVAQAYQLGEINQLAAKLISKHWPGGLTIVVKAKARVPKIIQGRKATVGLRLPQNRLVLRILKKLKTGIVAGSANFSSRPVPIKKELIDQALLDQVDLLVDGKVKGATASTVVDLTQGTARVLRKGIIPTSELPLDK